MRQMRMQRTNGQSLAVVALFMGLLFAFMGLAIDGGMVYMQRRLMQNTADAACLAAANQLALGASDTVATTRAEAVIADNLGPSGPGTGANAPGTLSYTNIADIYASDGAAGVALGRGIEINGSGVRIALQSPASTFFLRVIGIQSYTVAARAHCGSTDGGGVNPFSITRWRGYKNNGDIVSGGPSTDQALPQTYSQGSANPQMTVRDLLRRESQSAISAWPGWGTSDYPGDPLAATGLYSTPPANQAATVANPGPETTIAGNDANSNIPSNTSFTGPIVLDFRNVTFPQPLFYNGLLPSTSLNQYKDFASRYILGPYPGPWVQAGQQLAYYSGVSAGQITRPFDLRYDVGQIVTVLIYNGTIYDTGQSFTANFATSVAARQTRTRDGYSGPCSFDTTTFDGVGSDQTTRKPAASYTINVTPQVFSRYNLRAFLSTDPANWGDLQGSWNGGGYANFQLNTGAATSIGTNGGAVQLSVQPSISTDCEIVDPVSLITSTVSLPTRVNGAQSIYIELQDQATSRRRGTYAFLNMNADANDFYASVPGQLAYQPFEPGNSSSVEFMLETAGNGTRLFTSGGNAVSVDPIQWYAPGNIATAISTGNSYNGVQVSVTTQGNGSNKKTMLNFNIQNNALTGREYYVKVPFSYNGYQHSLWYYVQVRAPLNNSQSINQFVYALGYANFEITAIDSNSIRGRAVSGLLQPDQVKMGMQPRLLPWD